jgi:hypothetical protein
MATAPIMTIENLKWGLRWGLIVAIAFTGIVVVVALVAGPPPEPSGGPTVPSLIGFYFLGGTIGGLLVGILRPVTAHKAGAIVVGTIVTAVLLTVLEYLYVMKDRWTMVDTVLVTFLSLVGGPITALMIWEGNSRMHRSHSNEQGQQRR